MAAYEFTVIGDPARARQTAAEALEARQFVMHWSDEWTAKAVKGNKTKATLFGSFTHYMEIAVAVRSLDPEHSVIRIDSLTSGWLGGIWGVRKTEKQFAELREHLGVTFLGAGVLVAHRAPAAPS
ncbi:hypothetical protein [Ilumatobacter sp.]|uniref:hypothetical protein n=1 Tax=Ilumatobacter sp. TaxID=1967498 RepID=UPI003C4886BF